MNQSFVGLAGVKGGRLIGGMARSVHGFLRVLRLLRCCSAAGDHGAVTVWIDDLGLYRCDFSRYHETVATGLWSTKRELKAWLAEWLPRCYSEDGTQQASVIVVGPQGCGKTLNAPALAKAFGLPHWCEADERLPRTGHLIVANAVPAAAAGLTVLSFRDAIKRVPKPHPATPA